jgi:uncharacterized protein YoaH (UPF0181 family)
MNTYDADREPNPRAWLELEEATRIDLVVSYHRRHHPQTPRIRLHATFHAIVENQLAENEQVVVETLKRLQSEGLSRHDAIHAIGSVLAARVYHVLKTETPNAGEDPNEAYAAELRQLTADKWRNAGRSVDQSFDN